MIAVLVLEKSSEGYDKFVPSLLAHKQNIQVLFVKIDPRHMNIQ